ncbi:hypothetical protein HYT17_01860 [Candidatus Microgenomates bacterium]|nr:hypothetical protein [Candidatus Microgenomates bacterium]
MARKLLVLAREIGLALELTDIKVESLVPKSLRKLKSADDFLEKLKDYDKEFALTFAKAKNTGCVLRFVAKVEGEKASAKLEKVPTDSPLALTRGADNIFTFYTKRYQRPLVIQGPGAGAEVTAGGVLADILKI